MENKTSISKKLEAFDNLEALRSFLEPDLTAKNNEKIIKGIRKLIRK
ncbi:hypothetical protein HFP66_00575 [Bacillus sp. A17A.1]